MRVGASVWESWLGRRHRWVRRLVLLLVALLTAGLVLWNVQTPYYITAPGAAIDTSRLIRLPGRERRGGHLFMLVLNTQRANLLNYLYARLDPRSVLETKEKFLGNIPDYDKYLELTRQMMVDSQLTAKAIGEQRAGMGRGVQFGGAQVVDLATASPSKGALQKDDVITQAAGRPVNSAADLRALLETVRPGVPLSLRVRRTGKEIAVSVTPGESTDPARRGVALLGVFLKDFLTFDIPVPVTITAGSISGPSAGLMFTLQVIDQLSPQGLAGNLRIAGTGTIEANGHVGPIGGVQQKVFTAEAAGAQVMFVPGGNYAEAQKVATRVELVQVDTVDDALNWLKAHRQTAGHESPAVWL